MFGCANDVGKEHIAIAYISKRVRNTPQLLPKDTDRLGWRNWLNHRQQRANAPRCNTHIVDSLRVVALTNSPLLRQHFVEVATQQHAPCFRERGLRCQKRLRLSSWLLRSASFRLLGRGGV